MAKIIKAKKLNPRKLEDRLKQLHIDASGKKQLKLALLKKQHYRCAICGKDLKNADPIDIQLDHSHKPPFEIRGILCSYCNQFFLTKMNEAHPDYFYNAYKYLIKNRDYVEKLIEKFKKD